MEPLFLGFMAFVPGVILFIEVSHYLTGSEGSVPTFGGAVFTGIVLSLIPMAIILGNTSGETRLASEIFMPIILIGYNIGSVMVAIFYKEMGRTIIKARINKTDH